MDLLVGHSRLSIRQKKEWGEILTGFETLNKYVIKSENDQELLWAFEEGNFFLRNILSSYRSFTMNIMTPDQRVVLKLQRPFRFYFHEMDIIDAGGEKLGSVKRQFSFFRRIYDVFDAQGQLVCNLFGPVLKPWTFFIKQDDQEVGKITKEWSGLGKEALTDADNFGIVFPQGSMSKERSLLLGAVFLIDFVHFERAK